MAAEPRVEGDVIVVELRLSCNLQDQTLEQVIGKMKTSHVGMVESMLSDLKQSELPELALRPLQLFFEDTKQRHHGFFNVRLALPALPNHALARDISNCAMAVHDRFQSSFSKRQGRRSTQDLLG